MTVTTLLPLPSTLQHAQAPACLAQWLQALPDAGASVVQVQASALEVFDSSALAALLGLRRAVPARGHSLQVLNMPPRLAQLAQLYGVLSLLQGSL